MATENTTFEEAKLCPRCSMPGEDVSQTPAPHKRGSILHFIWCRTNGCPWQDTNWVVQVDADGTIPQHDVRKTEKMYPQRSMTEQQRAVEALERQFQAETEANSEVKNPFTRF